MKENATIVYYLTMSLFLGYGINLLFSQSGKDCYIGAFCGMLIGFLLSWLIEYINKKKKDEKLKEFLKRNKKMGLITRILFIIASYVILLYTLIIYKTFVSSFLLIRTPEIVILIPFLILACYAAFKSLTIISRVALALLPLSLFLFLAPFFGIIGLFDTSNFLPIMTNTPTSFLSTVISFASISIFPNLLALHLKKDTKGIPKMYLLASLILIGLLIYINGVFGEELVRVFRFPEYMVLKQLKLFQFIEKVENILSTSWAFSVFITSTMAIYSIKELLPQKKSKLTTGLSLVILTIIIDKVFAFDYVNEVRLYYTLPYISGILTIVILSLFIYLIKKPVKKKLSKK